MQEIWKPYPEFPEHYEASSLGRVRRSSNGPSTFVGKILKPSSNGNGYYHVVLCVNGKMRARPVHRIVAFAFHGKCPDGMEVNHKNGIKSDNSSANLEYCTASENTRHAFRHGLIDQKGEKNARAKLNWEKVRSIRDRYTTDGCSQQSLGNEYGVCQSVVSSIIRNQLWVE